MISFMLSGYGEWLKPSLASLQRWERGPLACLMPHNGFVSLGVSQVRVSWSVRVDGWVKVSLVV
jgi:hypothetical protein